MPTPAMFATNYFLISFLLIGISSASTCSEGGTITATNVSAVGVTVSPVNGGPGECDCRCAVKVEPNVNASGTQDTSSCNEGTDSKTLVFLIALTVTNVVLLVALILIVILYGVIMFRKKYGWIKYLGPNTEQPNTDINDAYGILEGNEDVEDPYYSNEGYSRVECVGTDSQQQIVTKTNEDTQAYSIVEAAGSQVQLRSTARYQEDPQGYSRVESAGTEAQRLSTALLITNSDTGAGDSEEYEYSYTDLRFSDSKLVGGKEKGKKSGKEKEEKSELEKEKGELSELVEEEVKSEPRKEKSEEQEEDKEPTVVSENQGGKVAAQVKIIEYTPVVVVSMGGAEKEPTAAANPFGVVLESPESSSSSSATAVSKPKKDPKPTPSKVSAAVSKLQKDPKPTPSNVSAAVSKLQKDLKFSESTEAKPKKHPKLAAFASASVEIPNVKKEFKVSRSRTLLPKFKKDSKSGQPTASANAAAGKKEKKGRKK